MKNGAAIIGGGGQAQVVAAILKAQKLPILGFFDDACNRLEGQAIGNAPVLGRCNEVHKHRDRITAVYLAIGDNTTRAKLFDALTDQGFDLPPLIHPWAMVETDATIGPGSTVCMGAMIVTQASVGKGCIVNTGCCLDHESVLEDFVHLAPRSTVAGRTRIGAESFVGMGTSIAQDLRIGAGAVIGANSVVLRNVAQNEKIVGVHH